MVFLTEISEIIHFDLAEAFPFFRSDINETYPRDIDPKRISLNNCLSLFRIFLKKNKWNVPEDFKLRKDAQKKILKEFHEFA